MKVYYTYTHVDPRSGEIVYIGKGRGGRAWDVTRARGQHKDHQIWMTELMEQGYIPSDWVIIEDKNLTDKDARNLELKLTHSHGGILRFNRQSGEQQHMAKMTNEQVLDAFKLRDEGMYHKDIAKLYGVARATITMALSGHQWKSVTSGVRFDNK